MSCFGGRDQQLYLVEILVEKIQLTPAKIKDIEDQPLMVKIKFLNFPVFEVTREDFDTLNVPPPTDDGIIHFMIGKSCLFIRKPKDLVEDLRTTIVHMGVFCMGDTYPVAETSARLPGCLCDQVAMSTNDPENLPKPYTITGGFHLVDPGENPSGMLDMELKLTCFGRFLTTRYELRPNFFTLKKLGDTREFCVERNIPPHMAANGAPSASTILSLQEQAAAEEKASRGSKKKRGKKKK